MSVIPVWVKLGAVALAVVVIGVFGYEQGQSREHDKQTAIIEKLKADQQTKLTLITSEAFQKQSVLIKERDDAMARLALVDSQRTKERNDALAKNSAMAYQLAHGSRMHLNATCAPSNSGGSNLPGSASTARVGNAGTIELPPEVGQSVLDIRAGIISDQVALKTLQDYISTACVKQK